MAKDPAVLFYTADFLTGTFTMTDAQVGKYIRLLCLQHQYGKLTEEQMLHVCGTYDEQVFSKFEKSDGFYCNKRMFEEAKRRKKYCESRKKARQSIKNKGVNKNNVRSTYVKRMENEIENVTETEINNEKFKMIKLNFKNDFRWKEKFCWDKNISMPELENLMDDFINDIELKEDYKDLKELKRHFLNTYNKRKNETRTFAASDKHAGARQLIESLKHDYRRKNNPGT